MAHSRNRFLSSFYQKQRSFWPAVGIFGLRQVGKTTFIQNHAAVKSIYTFDDDDVRGDAEASAKAFIGKIEKPTALDEAQKVPAIFDAVKSFIDRKRIPGTFTLSGSSTFSAYQDIRESLTGRIGNCHLYPMTFAEAHRMNFTPLSDTPLFHPDSIKKRIKIEDISAQMKKGGMPVPTFARDFEMRKQYWRGWIETTLGRDLYRIYGRGYNPDLASRILNELGEALSAGELPNVSHLSVPSTKALKYLTAFCNIFLLKKIECHTAGIGRDVYCISDSGLADAIMNHPTSTEATLTLARTYIQNEIEARLHYSGETFKRIYYKSAKGSPVDWVWNKIPIKVVTSLHSLGWEKRALEGAMKKLGSKYGIIAAPTDQLDLPIHLQKASGIVVVPWSYWS